MINEGEQDLVEATASSEAHIVHGAGRGHCRECRGLGIQNHVHDQGKSSEKFAKKNAI